jgi:hypothetical protein
MPNHDTSTVPTSVNLSPQQRIDVTVNNLPTIDAPAFVDPVGEFFRVLELEPSLRILIFFCSLSISFGKSDALPSS